MVVIRAEEHRIGNEDGSRRDLVAGSELPAQCAAGGVEGVDVPPSSPT